MGGVHSLLHDDEHEHVRDAAHLLLVLYGSFAFIGLALCGVIRWLDRPPSQEPILSTRHSSRHSSSSRKGSSGSKPAGPGWTAAAHNDRAAGASMEERQRSREIAKRWLSRAERMPDAAKHMVWTCRKIYGGQTYAMINRERDELPDCRSRFRLSYTLYAGLLAKKLQKALLEPQQGIHPTLVELLRPVAARRRRSGRGTPPPPGHPCTSEPRRPSGPVASSATWWRARKC